MAVCASTGQTPSGGESGIEGVITISPSKPGPARVDAPGSVPLANATFVVENKDGEVASFTTDDKGHFRTALPPGHLDGATIGVKNCSLVSRMKRYLPFLIVVGLRLVALASRHYALSREATRRLRTFESRGVPPKKRCFGAMFESTPTLRLRLKSSASFQCPPCGHFAVLCRGTAEGVQIRGYSFYFQNFSLSRPRPRSAQKAALPAGSRRFPGR